MVNDFYIKQQFNSTLLLTSSTSLQKRQFNLISWSKYVKAIFNCKIIVPKGENCLKYHKNVMRQSNEERTTSQ